MTDDILKDYDALDRSERAAWRAWFNGGLQNVVQYQNKPDNVFMGKAECEWVPFSDFWLGKVIDLGWMTAEVQDEYTAIGAVGQPKAVEYLLWPTELGFDVREAELARFRKHMSDM